MHAHHPNLPINRNLLPFLFQNEESREAKARRLPGIMEAPMDEPDCEDRESIEIEADEEDEMGKCLLRK